MLRLWSAVCLILLTGSFAYGQVISPIELADSQHVGIYLAPFDPLSKAETELARGLIYKHHLDLLVMVPFCTGQEDECLPRAHRLAMIEEGTTKQDKLRTLPEGNPDQTDLKAFHSGLRYLVSQLGAKNISMFSSQSEDYKHVPSYSQLIYFNDLPVVNLFSARDYFANRPSLFINPNVADAEKEDSPVSRTVWKYIVGNGLYLGGNHPAFLLRPPTTVFKQTIKHAARVGFDHLGIFALYSALRVAEPYPTEPPAWIRVGSHNFEVVRYLGSGGQNCAYVVKHQGTLYVLKIPRSLVAGDYWRYSQETINVHRWLLQEGMPQIPGLPFFDRFGRWSLSDYIEGDSWYDRMHSHQEISEGEREGTRIIFDYAMKMYARNGMRLDLAPRNIVFRDDTAYLVDLGIVIKRFFPRISFEAWTTRWARAFGREERNVLVRDCVVSMLTRAGISVPLFPYLKPGQASAFPLPRLGNEPLFDGSSGSIAF